MISKIVNLFLLLLPGSFITSCPLQKTFINPLMPSGENHWNKDGTPFLGEPSKTGVLIPSPLKKTNIKR